MSDKHHKKHRHEEEHHDEFTSVKHTVKRKRTERKLRKKRKKVNHLKTFLSSIKITVLNVKYIGNIRKITMTKTAQITLLFSAKKNLIYSSL